MGSYCELRIGKLTLESWKNDIDPSIMMLFVESDKRIVASSKEEWESEGCDPEYWSIDLDAESRGRYFLSHIRDHFRYERLAKLQAV